MRGTSGLYMSPGGMGLLKGYPLRKFCHKIKKLKLEMLMKEWTDLMEAAKPKDEKIEVGLN